VREIGISVVMPAYNASEYIERTILSLQEQSYRNWELLVIDDCSTDGTSDLVNRLALDDVRIRLIKLKENFGGPAGPRNIGVKKAQYDLIAFLDSDDIWHPQKLERQVELIGSSKNFFSCSSMIDFEDDANIRVSEISEIMVDDVDFMAQSLRAKIPTSSVLVSKELMIEFPFEESADYKAVEDFHCWLRILESGITCKKIRQPLLFYRKSEGQISGQKLQMMKKVFMVHYDYEGRGFFKSVLFTISHVMGGFYFRFLRKGM